MATPTEAEVQAQIGAVVDLLNEARKFGNVNAANFVGLEDVIVQAMEGDFADAVLGAVASLRSNMVGVVSSESAAAALTPLFLSYAKVKGYPFTDIPSIFAKLAEDFDTASDTVQTRDISHASPSAGGSNVGDGVLNRLTVDRYGYDLEAQHVEAKRLEIIRDEHSNADEHEEVGQLEGANANRDVLDLAGSGAVDEIVAVSKRQTERYVRNPSFDDYEGAVGAGNMTALDGWTVASAGFTKISADETNTYRGAVGTDTPVALVFDDNEKITQNLSEVGSNFDPNVPVYVQVAWNRSIGSGDGTLNLRFGTNSVNVALAAQSGWQILRLVLDENLYYDIWNENGPDIEVELASRTTGTTLVDDIIVTPMSFFDGTWYAMVGGATPFLRKDLFTWTDTEVGAILNYWFWRAFGLTLPGDGTPTWAEP